MLPTKNKIENYIFAKSEISKFKMSLMVYQNVVWFDITVNIIHLMHILQSKNQFCHIETSVVFTKDITLDKQT